MVDLNCETMTFTLLLKNFECEYCLMKNLELVLILFAVTTIRIKLTMKLVERNQVESHWLMKVLNVIEEYQWLLVMVL